MHRKMQGQRGDTLVELLAAVAILGIGVTGLVTALAGMAKTTVSNRSQARVETALLAASEFVKTMPLTASDFTRCGPAPANLTAAQVAVPTDVTVGYLQGSAVGAVPCGDLVQILVTAAGDDGFSLQLAVVRRP